MKNFLFAALLLGSNIAFATQTKPGDCDNLIEQAIYAAKMVTHLETTRSTLKMINKENLLSDRFEENLQRAENEARDLRGLVRIYCKD